MAETFESATDTFCLSSSLEDLSTKDFHVIYPDMKAKMPSILPKFKDKDNYACIVRAGSEVMAYAVLAIEPKYIHHCSSVGHIIDIMVKDMAALKPLEKEISSIAKSRGCYKCIIDVKPDLVGLLTSAGYKSKDLQMMATNLKVKKITDSTFSARELRPEDFYKGFMKILKQLTVVGDVCEKEFKKQYNCIQNRKGQTTVVVENKETGDLIGTATLLVLEHSTRRVGHIEDVVVDSKIRGKGLGTLVVTSVLNLAAREDCMACILNCSEENSKFYMKCGFKKNLTGMAKYYK